MADDTVTYSGGEGLQDVLSDMDDRIAAGSGGGGGWTSIIDLTSDATFSATTGNWTNTGGTKSRVTDHHLPGFAGSMKYVSAAFATSHLDLPLSGTFESGKSYFAVVFISSDDSNSPVSTNYTLSFGLLGTDNESKLDTVRVADDGISLGNFEAVAIQWTPTADRTGVSLRIDFGSQASKNFYVGYVLVSQSEVLPVVWNPFYPNGDSAGAYIPRMAGSYQGMLVGQFTYGGLRVDQDTGFTLASDDQSVAIQAFKAGGPGIIMWSANTAGDKTQEGIDIEVGEDFLGFFIGEKNSTTVQFYADFGDYNFEFEDGATGQWKTTDGTLTTPLANLHYLKHGTADPSAGAGVASPIGSIYGRNNSGVGELWLKTGAADTAWTKQTTP